MGLSIIMLVATIFIVIYILYNIFSEDREKGKEQRAKELEKLKKKNTDVKLLDYTCH